MVRVQVCKNNNGQKLRAMIFFIILTVAYMFLKYLLFLFGFSQASINPDYDNPGTFIFASENWDICEKLVLFIHGSGQVKAGQWTRKYVGAMFSLSMQIGMYIYLVFCVKQSVSI